MVKRWQQLTTRGLVDDWTADFSSEPYADGYPVMGDNAPIAPDLIYQLLGYCRSPGRLADRRAQVYPSRPVTMIGPFPPGGTTGRGCARYGRADEE
jgi:hypothetical protein